MFLRAVRILLLSCPLWLCATAHAEQIRDIADFAGIRPNSLVGYGLVVGLDGSGDPDAVVRPLLLQGATIILTRRQPISCGKSQRCIHRINRNYTCPAKMRF